MLVIEGRSLHSYRCVWAEKRVMLDSETITPC